MSKPEQQDLLPATRETAPASALELISRAALDPAVDPAKLRELLGVKQAWEADEARKAFAASMADFQTRCPIIAKADTAYDKPYARIDRIHRETRALRRECGFFFTWTVAEIKDGIANMEGILGHRAGHTVPLKQVIPLPDVLKGMNATQRAGAAQTYAKRYAECLALDIVTGEDDDGNAGAGETITSGQADALTQLCEATHTDAGALAKAYGAPDILSIPANMYEPARRTLEAKQRKAGAR